ncbi:serine hydrolase domain-containing protein [Flavisphingomonas formosensis]|uniref:serine hydrolase domain-containing protein n=1 Tax=Flavisphingomonas formosensis TaxID=861534 RepID=UPI0012FA2A2C|nr:serine hydrolase domain-containing protein [Sphingomonas formosensis]
MRPLAALLLALLAVGAAPAATLAPRLDALVELAHRDRHFDGVVLIGRDDDIAYSRAIGEEAPGVPMRTDSVWRLASLTKQVTALLVMQQVAAGTIDLDSPVSRYWPTWPSPHAGQITIRMLLKHMSGLADPEDSPKDAQGVPGFYRARGALASPMRNAAGYCALKPRTPPGIEYHYNNCDYLVLGALLQIITGQSYADLVQQRIAGPLGLDHFGLFSPARPDSPATMPGYDTEGRPGPRLNLGVYGAAGSLFGTPQDIWRFDRALMAGTLLDAAATAEMWKGDPAIGMTALGAWSYTVALAGCPDPVALVERRGAIGGIQIRNFFEPSARIAVILLTNRAAVDFGEIWQGKGLSYDFLSTALCPAPTAPNP